MRIRSVLSLIRTPGLVVVAMFTAINVSYVNNVDAGEKAGGGGNVIQYDQKAEPFLLDRFMLHPELAKQNARERTWSPTHSNDSEPEISSLKESDFRALDLANKKLDAWINALSKNSQNVSLQLLKLIKTSVNDVSYLRTSHSFKTVDRYFLPESLRSRHAIIRTAILFIDTYGALISAPVWDSLSVETQAGLLIHEGLRQMQFQYGIYDIEDEEIQFITAAIVDIEPNADTSIEVWMSPYLRAYSDVKAQAARGGLDAVAALLVGTRVDENNARMGLYERVRSKELSQPEQKRVLDDLLSRRILR